MSSPLKELRRIAVLLLLSFSTAENVASVFQAQPLPAGVAGINGFAKYMVSAGVSYPIRRARVELWEDTLIDAKLATSQTNDICQNIL